MKKTIDSISICILTKNAENTLAKTLDSTLGFKEVILLDNFSTDKTVEIAKKYPHVKVFQKPFMGFGKLRNEVASLASNDWILALDSDETLSPSILEELKNTPLQEKIAYLFLRENYYNGKKINGCGWGNEKVARLYNRNFSKYSSLKVHEKVEAEEFFLLKSPIYHIPYQNTAQFLFKMQHYSTLFAEEYRGKKSSSLKKAIFHAGFSFFKSYFLKRGIFLRKEGFLISLYNANTTFYKYIKLLEANEGLKEK